MPKEFNRVARIGDLIKRELTTLLQTEIADVRLKFITITSVKVSRDLSLADIYFTKIDIEDSNNKQLSQEITAKLLKKAATRLRYVLAQRLQLRIIPHLRFFYDNLTEEAYRLHDLIDRVVTEDKTKHSGDTNK